MQILLSLWLALIGVGSLAPSSDIGRWQSGEWRAEWSGDQEAANVQEASAPTAERIHEARAVASLPTIRIADGGVRGGAPSARYCGAFATSTTIAASHAIQMLGARSFAANARGGVIYHFPTAPPSRV